MCIIHLRFYKRKQNEAWTESWPTGLFYFMTLLKSFSCEGLELWNDPGLNPPLGTMKHIEQIQLCVMTIKITRLCPKWWRFIFYKVIGRDSRQICYRSAQTVVNAWAIKPHRSDRQDITECINCSNSRSQAQGKSLQRRQKSQSCLFAVVFLHCCSRLLPFCLASYF